MKINLIFEKDKKSKSLMKLQLNDLTIPMSEKDLENLIIEFYNKRDDLFENCFARGILVTEIDRLKEEIENLECENKNLREEINLYMEE